MSLSFPAHPSARRAAGGFTLLELMIVVVIVGILAAVAYPSYVNYVRKARRADAVQAVAQWQQAQERWRVNNATYGTTTNMTTAPPAGMGLSSTSADSYYTLAITANTATAYTIEATAVSGKSQASDTGCTKMIARVSAGQMQYLDANGTSSNCWAR